MRNSFFGITFMALLVAGCSLNQHSETGNGNTGSPQNTSQGGSTKLPRRFVPSELMLKFDDRRYGLIDVIE
ncbi:MAG: hypothetical protein KGQ59_01210, partial [Bdellovibrionales bacterium]|nr:hypothetical protein [Bdellovibrionales bacterium]